MWCTIFTMPVAICVECNVLFTLYIDTSDCCIMILIILGLFPYTVQEFYARLFTVLRNFVFCLNNTCIAFVTLHYSILYQQPMRFLSILSHSSTKPASNSSQFTCSDNLVASINQWKFKSHLYVYCIMVIV